MWQKYTATGLPSKRKQCSTGFWSRQLENYLCRSSLELCLHTKLGEQPSKQNHKWELNRKLSIKLRSMCLLALVYKSLCVPGSYSSSTTILVKLHGPQIFIWEWSIYLMKSLKTKICTFEFNPKFNTKPLCQNQHDYEWKK